MKNKAQEIRTIIFSLKKGFQEKETFISVTNGIIFIGGYCMSGLNLQLLLVIGIVSNTYMLPI